MKWTTVNFGRHKGKTLPQILFRDPDWFFWAMATHAFDNKGQLATEAKDIYYKATHIKIPNNENGQFEVQYFIHMPSCKFNHFEIVPAYQPEHRGSSHTMRNPLIDMSVPTRYAAYDKQGNKNLLYCLKLKVLGSDSIRMTKQKCEDFFDNPDNFA